MKTLRTLFILLLFTVAGQAAQAQILKTKLEVTVLDEIGNVVEGAKVMAFDNRVDYENLEKPGFEGVTDHKGKITFKGVIPTEYYLYIEKGDMTNYGGGEKTAKLDDGKTNRIRVVISDELL